MKRSALLPDPHKVRAFHDRARDKLAQESFGLPRKALARGKRKPSPKVPTDVARVVRARSKGRCVCCLHEGKPKAGRAEHLHHVWRKERFPEYAAEADGIVGACATHHLNHEYAPDKRMPLDALPACVFAMYGRVSEAARAYFDRIYGAPSAEQLQEA